MCDCRIRTWGIDYVWAVDSNPLIHRPTSLSMLVFTGKSPWKIIKLPWIDFELKPIGNSNNVVALKAHNGKYVSASGGNGDLLYASATRIGASETFTGEDQGNGRWKLKANGGLYVCASLSGFLETRRLGKIEIMDLTTFVFESIP